MINWPGRCGAKCLFFKFVSINFSNTVRPFLSGHPKRRPKIGLQDRLWLNAGQKYCRMLQESILQESILQYLWPSLNYYLSLRPLFCLFLSGRLRQVLLYRNDLGNSDMDFYLEKNCYIKLFVVICFYFFHDWLFWTMFVCWLFNFNLFHRNITEKLWQADKELNFVSLKMWE